ncbi:MAG: biopolymer transporter ExbD [Gammaproteobacteria bacterium]|jgi:biopolymer transport protein ExbD|uniref:Biopolymer transporter ExbD n=1 Tax=Limnobacter profundi TaxID=2732163 RepID=A0ABX6N5N2_9BURK|nr:MULTISPECIES: biopolymer transporter ExbD [unclassified Limnobacter]MAG82010.1 biopolymer transporter ExbD [Sutterellaceae bacterium]MBA4315965.1 biopolymer transporter ExbD [Alcaligenaceae bacterium]MBU0541449.1 biopolymer transporter ExbD [Gammaproteobacteria bacterium]HAV73995.1 biopolymer transporter ExbD [Limnobacter sp.]QJR28952.1 biopolymer transporter ExbD [Limnobacter sp. SAORIC-580]|tara:strand:- start:7102 stop:7515 length:414 start_codon:yes stop_codon:yes gene_type:complete
MSFNSYDDQQEMSEINMTPLVDVMLVLLIIFIITVPVITHSVKVDLPQASQQPTEVKPDVVTLTVQRDGSLMWNDETLTFENLELRLQAVAQQEKQPELRIQGDKAVEYEKVVQVMAAAQRAGVEKLGFMTEPQSTP